MPLLVRALLVLLLLALRLFALLVILLPWLVLALLMAHALQVVMLALLVLSLLVLVVFLLLVLLLPLALPCPFCECSVRGEVFLTPFVDRGAAPTEGVAGRLGRAHSDTRIGAPGAHSNSLRRVFVAPAAHSNK